MKKQSGIQVDADPKRDTATTLDNLSKCHQITRFEKRQSQLEEVDREVLLLKEEHANEMDRVKQALKSRHIQEIYQIDEVFRLVSFIRFNSIYDNRFVVCVILFRCVGQ